MTNELATEDWVPASCTLPTTEQPLRRAEFDDLFAEDALSVERVSSEQIRIQLDGDAEVAGRAARLAAKETGCCSFFTFGLTMSEGRTSMTVSTAESHAAVLAALADRAEAQLAKRLSE